MRFRHCLFLLAVCCAGGVIGAADFPRAQLTACNVTWDSPSEDAKGSMPLGNGDIGLNAWVESSGDLLFYISKTDAWDENMRLLKLGRVRVKFIPALARQGQPFRQTLDLETGRMLVSTPAAEVALWVDANHPVIQVEARAPDGKKLEAVVSFEVWRTEKREPKGGERHYFSSSLELPWICYPDVILPAKRRQIGWYHRNEVSPWLSSLKMQRNEAVAQTQTDPLLHRTFGAILRGEGWVAENDTTLKTAAPATAASLQIHVLTQTPASPESWLTALEKQAAAVEIIPAEERLAAHEKWWRAFWERSWIYISQPSAEAVLPVSRQPWRVGMDSGGRSRFSGKICAPRIQGRALDTDGVVALSREARMDSAELTGAETDFSQGITISAWINPGKNERGRILDKCTAGTGDGLLLDTMPGQSLRWIIGKKTLTAKDCLKPDVWQHVVATADPQNGTYALYLDGKLLHQEKVSSLTDRINQAYALQRFINAASGRGAYPIKFNGSIFTIDAWHSPDFRRWGGGYWWQNTRLPYWAMLSAGDLDLMTPLFKMYVDALPARREATRRYYNHAGAFFPETITFWGNYLDQNYGIKRDGKPDGLTDNQYIRYHWQGGIELVLMMLHHYEFSGDTTFRETTLLPLAREIFTFYDQHWPRDSEGKIRFDPAQACETWWTAVNPTPELAGLHYVLPRLIALSGTAADQKAWGKTLADLRPVPLGKDEKTDKTIIRPAYEFSNKKNIENPGLYAIFPYPLYTLTQGREAMEIGRATYEGRDSKSGQGWHQDSIQAALLGNASEARRYTERNVNNTATGFRFPAMWGPNYDWLPDQCHGGNFMHALQKMLVQYEGDKIIVLPAWPKDWDCEFKLHAPRNTTVRGVVRNGMLEVLEVSPASRRGDTMVQEVQ